MHQARKRFGQNFLHDEGIIHAIVSLIGPSSDVAILEIGPGLGALTKPLLANLESLDLLEIDRDLVAYWRKQQLPGLIITEGDALNFDFLAWARTKKPVAQNRSRSLVICPTTFHRPYYFIWLVRQQR